MDKERFEKQLAFILEADKEKNIFRQTHLSGHGRRETDAEHAWHMAMMTACARIRPCRRFLTSKARRNTRCALCSPTRKKSAA